MLMNEAKTNVEINELIRNRWSPRAFKSDPIEDEKLLRLFEAARWSSSSYNEQPWRFIVGVKNSDNSYRKIIDTLVPFNQKWASKAPVVFLACGKKSFSRNGKKNPHFRYDVGQAVATMALQATEDNLHIHQMAGFNAEKARINFNIPNDYEPIVVAAVGYISEKTIIESEGPKERKRKDLKEIFFEDDWDKGLNLIQV